MKIKSSLTGAFHNGMNLKSCLRLGFITGVCLLAPPVSHAGLIVSDNAGNYTSWGSTATSSTQSAATGSTGIASPGWTFDNPANTPSQSGSFLGSSANINSSSGNSWGLYANSGQTADAFASFSAGSLQAGQQLSVQMQNTGIATGGSVGISLRNSSGQNVFEFYFNGGGSQYNINVWQNAGTGNQIATTVGYTSGPLTLNFNQQSAGGWSFDVYSGNTLDQTLSSSSTSTTLWSSISQIRFFDYNSGGGNNVYFNNLAVVPEPVTLALPIFGGLVLTAGLSRRFLSRVPAT